MIVGVTGGSGFVGKRLVNALIAEGHTVRILSRRIPSLPVDDIQHYTIDLINPSSKALKSFVNGLDIIYHCAGEIRDLDKMEMLHVQGTKALVEAATGSIGRWIQLSSAGAYGNVREGLIDETHPEAPTNIYEKTKTVADHIVLDASNSGAFEALLLRPSAIIGLEMSNQSVYDLLKKIDRGHFFFIGPKGATRNYIHVNDVVHALVLAGFHPTPKGRIFNLSNCCTIEQFVYWACQAYQRPDQFLRVPELPARILAGLFTLVPGFPLTPNRVLALTNRATFCMDAINNELGYRHSTSIQSAIIEMAQRTRMETL